MARLGKIGLCAAAALVAFIVATSTASAASNGVMSWGANSEGELCDGSLDHVAHPVTVPALDPIAAISAGGFTLALRENASRTVFACGENEFGQLGIGKEGGHSSTPVEVHGLSEVIAVSAGTYHGLALEEVEKPKTRVKAWGRNRYGELGIGTTENHDIPEKVHKLENVTAVAAGYEFSLALESEGHVWAWGDDASGQLGYPGPEKCDEVPCSKEPEEVPGLEHVKAIAAGGEFALALLEDGEVVAWGNNQYGQLGDGTTEATDEHVHVKGLSKEVVAISAGFYFGLALEDRHVKAWGRNEWGELGDGHGYEGPEKCDGLACSKEAGEVSGLSDATAISAGYSHGLALLENGTVEAWGENEDGELGYDTFTGPDKCGGAPCSRTPVPVSEIAGEIVGISAGWEYSLALGPQGPLVTKLKPASGSPHGETEVTIEGYNLTGVTKVMFGTNEAAIVHPEDPLIVKSPPGGGKVCVKVTTSTGSIRTSPCSDKSRFDYAEGGPEYGKCVEVAKGTGNFSNAGCTTGSTDGSFKWEPGVYELGFTLSGEASVLETVGKEKITCKGANGHGEYEGRYWVGETVVKLTGCEHAGSQCTSSGAAEGELVTNELEGELGWRDAKEGLVGLAFMAEAVSSVVVVEGTCGPTKMVIEGSVIAHVETDKMLETSTLKFEAKDGKQKPEKFEEEEKDILETKFGEAKAEQAGLTLSIKQTNEDKEKVEVNARV